MKTLFLNLTGLFLLFTSAVFSQSSNCTVVELSSSTAKFELSNTGAIKSFTVYYSVNEFCEDKSCTKSLYANSAVAGVWQVDIPETFVAGDIIHYSFMVEKPDGSWISNNVAYHHFFNEDAFGLDRPGNLTAEVVGCSEVLLKWDDIDGELAYKIFYSADGTKPQLHQKQTYYPASGYTVGGLDENTQYTFWVSAFSLRDSSMATITTAKTTVCNIEPVWTKKGDDIIYVDNYNVGIGTPSPEAKLDVYQGDALFSYRMGSTRVRGSNLYFDGSYGPSALDASINLQGNNGLSIFQNYNSTEREKVFAIDNTGNVTIGAERNHIYKLAVGGSIIAEEIVVKLQKNWPDYVFDNDYDLMSIDEVHSYIKENKHLPGIPCATDVEEKGIGLKEMNVAMMQKMEEMMLYIIQLKADNEALQSQIETLK